MADNFGVYNLTARLEAAPSSSYQYLTNELSGNVNLRRGAERELRDHVEIVNSRKEHPSFSSVFVIPEISSSQHAVTSLNARFSGTSTIEATAVPATQREYYSKENRLIRKIYKLSASLGGQWNQSETDPSSVECVERTPFDPVSGSFKNLTDDSNPLFIDVPDYGKIKDIKVWVEFVHDIRGGPGSSSADSSNPFWLGGSGDENPYPRQGLQGLRISMRSPNVQFDAAHPLWNDPTVKNFEKSPKFNPFMVDPQRIPNSLRGTYLLWSGTGMDNDLYDSLGNHVRSSPTSWDSETLITGSNELRITSYRAKLDRNGLPVIAFSTAHSASIAGDPYSDSDLRILYFKREGSGNTRMDVLVDSARNVLSSSYISVADICLELDGVTPVISYTKRIHRPAGGYDEPTFVARSSSLGWVSTGSFRDGGRIAVNSEGSLGILTAGDEASSLSFKIFSGSNVVEESDMFFSTGRNYFWANPEDTSIVTDGNGVYHMCLTAVARDALYEDNEYYTYYLKYDHGVFTSELVHRSFNDFFSEGGYYNKIAIRKDGVITLADRWVQLDENTLSGIGGVISVSSGSDGWTKKKSPTSFFGFGVADCEYDLKDNFQGLSLSLVYKGVSGSFDPGDTALVFFHSSSTGFSFEPIPGLSGIEDFEAPGIDANSYLEIDEKEYTHVFLNYSGAFGSIESTNGTVYHMSRSFASTLGSYHTFDTDIDMRTIFSDSSEYKNPRSLAYSYSESGKVKPQIERVIDQHEYASPTSASVALFTPSILKYSDPVFFHDAWLSGSNIPWFIDDRIPVGKLRGMGFGVLTASLGRGVPAGWLTGPSGSADVNEWPTKGMQLGPETIRPVYPLLDDIYAEKTFFETPATGSYASNLDLSATRKIKGFRPGLRDTEVHGRWEFYVVNASTFDPSNPSAYFGIPDVRAGIWMRQIRLEVLIDQGQNFNDTSFVSRRQRDRRPHYVATRESTARKLDVVSGSSYWDIGTSEVYSIASPSYGRTTGIVTSKNESDFAVYVALTGAFVQELSGSGRLNEVQSTFLSNEFGTPYIPISSGSGEDPQFDALLESDVSATRKIFTDILNPRTLIPVDNTLDSFISRENVIKTTSDMLTDIVSSGSL